MNEQLIQFKTAKLAKEKGWDINCSNYYFGKAGILGNLGTKYTGLGTFEYEAPTQSLLQRWLREKHDIHIYIWKNTLTHRFRLDSIYNCDVQQLTEDTEYDTYEQALEVGLQEGLKLIKI